MKIKSLFAGAMAVVAIVLASCSRPDELLSAIPATSRAVAVVNVDALLSDMGCEIKDGKVVMPQGVSLRADVERSLNQLAVFAGGADMKNVVIAEGSVTYATFTITDVSAVEKALAKAGFDSAPSRHGFDCYTSGGGATVYLGSGQGWLLMSRGDFSPKEELAAAKQGSVRSRSGGIASFLDNTELMSAAVSTAGIGFDSKTDDWVCVSAASRGNSLNLRIHRMTAEGALIENSGLRQLDAAALKMLPASAPVMAAVGLDKDIDWTGVATIGGMVGGFQTMGMIQSVLPYLQAVDGTVAVAALPRGADSWSGFSPGEWSIVFVAQMPKASALKAVEAVRAYVSRMMFTVTPIQDGFAVNQNGLNIKAFAQGDMLCIQSGDPAAGGGSLPGSNCAEVRITLPQGLITSGSPLQAAASADRSATTVSLSLPGYDVPFLQALLTDLSR